VEVISGASGSGRIKTLFKENGGQASAFNAGFSISGGDYVIFLDSDDTLLPSAVATLQQRLLPISQETSKLQYRLMLVDLNGSDLGLVAPACELKDTGSARNDLLRTGRYCTPPTSGNCFTRSFLKKVMPMPEASYRISADGYLITLAPLYGSVYDFREVLGTYRIHGANSWSSDESNRFARCVEHEIQRARLLEQHSFLVLGHVVSAENILARNFRHIASRISSCKLFPQNHPIGDDSLRTLVKTGIKVVMQDVKLGIPQKLLWVAWFILVGILPRRMARSIIAWPYYHTKQHFLHRLKRYILPGLAKRS
jgi:glycosyltransferase involved in cell wall biosynthesis